MFIDTHCHITSEDYDDISLIIEKIKSAGGNKIIVNGTDMKSNLEVLELVSKYDIVYGALGFHPTELDNFQDSDFLWLEEHINDDKIVALGEIGLDYHYDNTDKNKQNIVFRKQLEIAKKYNKPVIIHSRDASQDTFDILKKYNLKGSLHCFSGSLEMAKEYIKLGYLIGVGGVVTFKNAKNIVSVIENIDLEYILLETDSPYLTPVPFRGQKNDPTHVYDVAKFVADLNGVSIEELSKITNDNIKRVFDI